MRTMHKTHIVGGNYTLSALFFSLCFFITSISCTSKFLTIASDVESASYITEAYNAKYAKPLLRVLQYENVYENIVQSHANVLISRTIPPENIERNLFHVNVPKNSKNIVHIAHKKAALLAFSLPLIVTLKSSHMSMPINGALSFSELRTQVLKVSTNVSKNVWAFPLSPHENFKQIFPHDKAYEQWMQSITKNLTNATEIFVRRYSAIPFLAVLKDATIAYKFVPSHVFFSQPLIFRDLFSIAILTDNKNMIPIVAPIFISAMKREPYRKKHSAKKLFLWLLKTSAHNEIVYFSQEIFKHTPVKMQFLGRSYSNNADFTSAKILPRNSWLANHGPLYSSLYFARSK